MTILKAPGDAIRPMPSSIAWPSAKRPEKGDSGIAFDLIERFCLEQGVRNIRVDTDFPNKRMAHLEKQGFVHCGVIVFQGGEKLAYDKLL